MTQDERLREALQAMDETYLVTDKRMALFQRELAARGLAVVEIEPYVKPDAISQHSDAALLENRENHNIGLISDNAPNDNNAANAQPLLSDATISDREMAIARVLDPDAAAGLVDNEQWLGVMRLARAIIAADPYTSLVAEMRAAGGILHFYAENVRLTEEVNRLRSAAEDAVMRKVEG